MKNTGASPKTNWHEISSDLTLETLSSSQNGLTLIDAEARFSTHGPNRILQAFRHNSLVRFLLHFHNVLSYVLLGAALITTLLGHSVDTGLF